MSDGMRIAAIVPVAAIEGAKTRLGESLDAEERRDLVERLLAGTIGALLAVHGLADILVVSPDRDVLELAATAGVRTIRQRTVGLNAGATEARDDVVAGGAEAIVVVPIDLPFITAEAVEVALAALVEARRAVVVAPDRHGSGTNLLALRPPAVIDFAFGPDSRHVHHEAALQARAAYRELGGPLSVDLDTPEDLVFVESTRPEDLRVS